jgi:hypothetical protein
MFVPRYDMIEPHIKVVASVDGGGDQVLMPAELFRFLLRCALEACEFDEAQYQQCNPDVAEGVERRVHACGRAHFLNGGYFEGRVGAVPVHEAWYLAHSPDVADAKRAGLEESGEAHYRRAGAVEWREPNPACVNALRAWRELLSRLPRAAQATVEPDEAHA